MWGLPQGQNIRRQEVRETVTSKALLSSLHHAACMMEVGIGLLRVTEAGAVDEPR